MQMGKKEYKKVGANTDEQCPIFSVFSNCYLLLWVGTNKIHLLVRRKN